MTFFHYTFNYTGTTPVLYYMLCHYTLTTLARHIVACVFFLQFQHQVQQKKAEISLL